MATAESYGTYLGDPQLPWKANDGDPATGWSSNGTNPSWLQIEFDGNHEIQAIGIRWGSHVHLYTVELSLDGQNWNFVLGPSLSNNTEGGPIVYEYLPIACQWARFVRINLLTTSAPASHIFQSSVGDLEAWSFAPMQVLADDFDDGVIDTNKWGILLPYDNSSVAEMNGVCELRNRGILHSLDSFDPAEIGDVKIRFEWKDVMSCATCGTDAFNLVTRSDLTQYGCCGQPTTGIFLHFSPPNPVEGPTANLWVSHTELIGGQQQEVKDAETKVTFSVPAGATVGMELIDTGDMVIGRVWDVDDPQNSVTMILGIPATAQAYLGDRIGIYNREAVGGDKIVNIDNLSVTTTGPPSVEIVRLGTPPNPAALLPGQTSGPVIGSIWDPVVDHSTFLTGATLDVLGFSVGPVNVPTPYGTVLCTPPFLNLVAPAGVPFAIPISADCTIVGVSLCVQAASWDGSTLAATNALDITVGTY